MIMLRGSSGPFVRQSVVRAGFWGQRSHGNILKHGQIMACTSSHRPRLSQEAKAVDQQRGQKSMDISNAGPKGPAGPARTGKKHPSATSRRQVLPVSPADAQPVSRPERTVTAMHKHYMDPEERLEMGRLLRTAAPRTVQGGPAFRLYCFGVDDLRLFKAVEEAGMVGRIVVVDKVKDADAVLATPRTRTGRIVEVQEARASAGKARIPYIELKRFSGIKLMQALAALMGVPIPQHLLDVKGGLSPMLTRPERDGARALKLLDSLDGKDNGSGPGSSPGVEPARGLDNDSGMGPTEPASSTSAEGSVTPRRELGVSEQDAVDAPAVEDSSRATGRIAAQRNGLVTRQPLATHPYSKLDVLEEALIAGQARGQSANIVLPDQQGIMALVDGKLSRLPEPDLDDVDVLEDRRGLVPKARTEQAAEKYKVLRPVKPGSRIRRKRVLRKLSEMNASW